MNIRLLSCKELLFNGSAEMVTLPGTLGDIGVLHGHTPLLTSLREGVISIYKDKNNSNTESYSILDGFVQIMPEFCFIYIIGSYSREE